MDNTNNDLEVKFNKFLEYDGALRDILIEKTELNDWKLLYDYLLKSDYKIEYIKDDAKQSLPKNIEMLFEDKDHTHTLSIQEENIILNLHIFFDISRIEIDVDPRDFVANEQYQIIINFMKNINNILSKKITITYENDHENIFYSIS